MTCGLIHNAGKTNSAKLLRMDPTRTLTLRNAFIKEIRRRMTALKLDIFDFLVKKDALGLKPAITQNATDRQFEFQTDTDKLASFNSWLQNQIDRDVLFAQLGSGVLSTASILAGQSVAGVGFGGSMGKGPWTVKYIESAYKKGLINAYLSSRRSLPESDPQFISESQEDFLRTAFLAPERLSKVQLLASRSFEQLKGLTGQMAGRINTILAQGMIDGKSVTQIAREMLDTIDGLTESRALMIARTEIIHAHAEGQLDAFSDLGVEQVGALVEWSTAGDDRVCPICAALEGKVYTIDDARGLIPQHPNCRCTWIPKLP